MVSRLLKYGGVSGKVRAMYGRRLKPDELSHLSSMAMVSDIASYLKNHPGWSECLTDMSIADIHRGRLEDLLRGQLFIDYESLMKFMPGDDTELMSYFDRSEIDQVLLFLRFLRAGAPEKYTFSPAPGVKYKSRIDFASLNTCDTFTSFLEAIRPSSLFKPLSKLFAASGSSLPDYTILESTLKDYAFCRFYELIDKSYGGEVGKILHKAAGIEIDIVNITRAVRIRRYFPALKENVLDYLIPVFYKYKKSYILKLASAPDSDAEQTILKTGPYGRVFSDNSIGYIEDYYYEELYEYYRRVIRSGIPSVATPIAYLHLKEVELKNLTSIIEMVRYKISGDKAPVSIHGTAGKNR